MRALCALFLSSFSSSFYFLPLLAPNLLFIYIPRRLSRLAFCGLGGFHADGGDVPVFGY